MKITKLLLKLLAGVICVILCQSCMTALLISSLADSGPKSKTITFDEGYIGKGEIKKKEFYNNRDASFHTNTMEPIIEGNITYKNGQAYIKGKWHISPNELLKGTFSISNTPEGYLSAKKNSGKLQISVIDVDEYETEIFHLKKFIDEKYNIDYRGISDETIHYVKAEVTSEDVKKFGYSNILKLLNNATKHTVLLKDNTIFSGYISIVGDVDSNYTILFKDGTWSFGTRGMIKNVTVSKPSPITDLTSIMVSLYDSNVRMVEFSLMKENLTNNVLQLFKQSNEGKLTYTSSDIYKGTYEVRISTDGKIEIIPLKGTYTLCNGQQLADNWIDRHDFSEEEKAYIRKHESPTSQFEAATALYNDKAYNEYYTKAENALSKRQYQDAVALYQKAGKYKNAEEMERKAREIKSLIDNELKKRQIIEKYGTYWGPLVYAKTFTIGMTREMCVDMVGTDTYDISKFTDRYGDIYESWRYNGAYETLASLIFDDNLFSSYLSSELEKQQPYQLEFENSILVGISYKE